MGLLQPLCSADSFSFGSSGTEVPALSRPQQFYLPGSQAGSWAQGQASTAEGNLEAISSSALYLLEHCLHLLIPNFPGLTSVLQNGPAGTLLYFHPYGFR